MDGSNDLNIFRLAQTLSQTEFTAKCPWFFIVGRSPLTRPAGPRPTIVAGMMQVQDLLDTGPSDKPLAYRTIATKDPFSLDSPTLALAIRKVRPMFPFMITLGRTTNNDMVLPDITISKFHAYFRVNGEEVDLTDAGSRNGSYVGDQKLVPNGTPTRLVPGSVVRFGPHSFELVTSAECWARLRALAGLPSSEEPSTPG
jgi:hypothetical protein